MHRKGSMELSVNSIVILVIAVVMMGLILGFIRSKFSDIGGGFVVDESPALEATASNPITLSRNLVSVSGTKKTGLNVNFYNIFTGPGSNNLAAAKPYWHCKGDNPVIIGEYFTKIATTSNMTSFSGNIQLQSSVAKDTYLCTVCFIKPYAAMPNSPNCDNVAPTNKIVKEFQLVVQ